MNDFQHSYARWADSHVFFDKFPQRTSHTDPLSALAGQWWERMVNDTPNGTLLTKNSLFDALTGDRTLHLLHVTHATESMTRGGALYPSGGCLVGSVYGAPLSQEPGGFRMHNLGEYVLTKEAPASARRLNPDRHSDKHAATPLVIKVTIPPTAYRGLAGIDYLRLGGTHLEIFQQLEYLLSRYERHQLREAIVSRVRNGMSFLSLCNTMIQDDTRIEPHEFLDLLNQATANLPILGYIYFEALAEYLMLHSTSCRTEELRDRGEFDNWLYKEMLFGLFPRMAGRFDLSKFQPTRTDLRRLLIQLCPNLSIDHLTRYLADRIAFLVNARLFAPGLQPGDWKRLQWEFSELQPKLAPLLGHLIHRELRTFGRYPDFYFYYDQNKALQAWNYWNHMDMVIPFNGTFPKGEIGINPAYPDLDYTIYRARLNDLGLIEPTEELDLRITPRLVDIKHTLMRNNEWTPAGKQTAHQKLA